jgi:hypothetical protein
MRRFLSAILALILSTQCALAQGSVQSPNLFWATPLSGTGFLTLRAIGVADLSGTTSNIAADTLLGNPTGSAAPAQPITILSPLVFSGTTLGLSSASTTVNGVVCTLGSTCTITAVAAAGTLTGATLASNVPASSLTSVGTLTGGATGVGFTLALGTSTLTGNTPTAHGGTGVATFTSNLPLIGNGAGNVATGHQCRPWVGLAGKMHVSRNGRGEFARYG